jgi:hypothetical protein
VPRPLIEQEAHSVSGSTSKIEGQNWRHGDLEDTLLTIVASKAMGGKKFSKLDVKRVSLTQSPNYMTSI